MSSVPHAIPVLQPLCHVPQPLLGQIWPCPWRPVGFQGSALWVGKEQVGPCFEQTEHVEVETLPQGFGFVVRKADFPEIGELIWAGLRFLSQLARGGIQMGLTCP